MTAFEKSEWKIDKILNGGKLYTLGVGLQAKTTAMHNVCPAVPLKRKSVYIMWFPISTD
jgi:hypothetical protein